MMDQVFACPQCGFKTNLIGERHECPKSATPKLIGVLARNLSEFWYYAKELCPEPKLVRWSAAEVIAVDGTQYFFINSTSRIRGIRAFKLVRVGNWHQRPDANEIEQMHMWRLNGSGIPNERWADYGAG